jgi:hypothetical protein
MQPAIATETAAKFQPLSKIARFETLHTLHVWVWALCMLCSPYFRLGNNRASCSSRNVLHTRRTHFGLVIHDLQNAAGRYGMKRITVTKAVYKRHTHKLWSCHLESREQYNKTRTRTELHVRSYRHHWRDSLLTARNNILAARVWWQEMRGKQDLSLKIFYNTRHSVVEKQLAESHVACQTPTGVRAVHRSAFIGGREHPQHHNNWEYDHVDRNFFLQ